MAKDTKIDKTLPDRLKKFLKGDKKDVGTEREAFITEGLKASLGKQSLNSTRLKAIREIMEIVKEKKMNEVEIRKLWYHVQDMVKLNKPVEERHLVLQLLGHVSSTTNQLGITRQYFFNHVVEVYMKEDVNALFNFFSLITNEGRHMKDIELEMGPFLVNYLPLLLKGMNPATSAINLITNVFKFNAAFLNEANVHYLVKTLVLNEPRSYEEVHALLTFMGSLIAYCYIPESTLVIFIGRLAGMISVPNLVEPSWKVMRNLLGTQMGNVAILATCEVIETAKIFHHVRGAIYFLTNALWTKNRIASISLNPLAVLPALQLASENHHPLVVYETAISVYRIVCNISSELHVVSWNLILNIVSKLFFFTANCENEEQSQMTLNVLHATLDVIDEMINSPVMWRVSSKYFDLVDCYSERRKVSSVAKLLQYKFKYLRPDENRWINRLNSLLLKHFRQDKRTDVRLIALQELRKFFDSHRYSHGEVICNAILKLQFSEIELDPDIKVRKASVSFLVHVILSLNVPGIEILLVYIEKVVFEIFGKSSNILLEAEVEDISEGINGLIVIFKRKLWLLPSSYAIKAYQTLMAFLELHYRCPSILNSVSSIRTQVFKMIFEMRADSNYHLGLPNCIDALPPFDSDEIPSYQKKYSPYIVVDHKFGFKPEFLLKKSSLDDEDIMTDIPVEDLKNIDVQRQDAKGVGLSDGHLDCERSETQVAHLSLTKAAWLVILAMKKERDWPVLKLILDKIPEVLQNKALILSKEVNDINYLATHLCTLVMDETLSTSHFSNVPAKFKRTDFNCCIYPVIANMASYHQNLEMKYQMNLIQCLQKGIQSNASALCIRAITLCALEMRVAMSKMIREVMLTLSKKSATVTNAQPSLEFLSTLLHLPVVYSNFSPEHYQTVFAIAIHYTNPFKFNQYIIALAYHVIALWFIKSRLPSRKKFVSFISKTLQTIIEQEGSYKSKSSSLNETDGKRDTDRIEFHRDLRETYVDFMSRYCFDTYSPLCRRRPVADFLVNSGQSQMWLIGTRIITITTSGCSQRPMKNGLCDKCVQFCCSGEADAITSTDDSSNRRRHKSEYHTSGTTEVKCPPQSKDDLHMKCSTIEGVDNENASANAVFDEPSKVKIGRKVSTFCSCWCKGWAEIHIRQPTGNVSWLTRIQNPKSVLAESEQLPVDDISTLYFPNVPTTGLIQKDEKGLTRSLMNEPILCSTSGDFCLTSSEGDLDGLTAGDWANSTTTSNPSSGTVSLASSSHDLHDEDVKGGFHNKVSYCLSNPEISKRAQAEFGLATPLDTREGLSTRVKTRTTSGPVKRSNTIVGTHLASDLNSRMRHPSAFEMTSSSSASGLTTADDSKLPSDIEPIARARTHTIADMRPGKYTQNETKGGVSPSAVFLQLFYQASLAGGWLRPVLLPYKNQDIERSIKLLDLIIPQENHKIGVLYVGPDQVTEVEILSNTSGSLRYLNFLEGLGTVHDFNDLPKDAFLGNLDRSGVDGTSVLLWQEDILQIVFHVATSMPNKATDPNCNGKKQHIGNDFVTIVYNESGLPYPIDRIRSHFNHAVIEIVPGDHDTNCVNFLCKDGVREFMNRLPEEPTRLVSDTNLSVLVRQIALHANMASMIWEMEKRGSYIPYWLQRLYKIRQIREKVLGKPESKKQFIDQQIQQFGTLELGDDILHNYLDFSDMVDIDKSEVKCRHKSSEFLSKKLY